MHDPLFDSPWLKWGQAVVHAQTLEAEIDAFRTGSHPDPLLASRTEYHPKRHGFGVYADRVVPMPMRWGLLVGDIANDFRCALDHLAWALVTRGKTPPNTLKPKAANQIYFPIYQDRREFNGSLPGKLPGVRRTDVAKVRRHQPYHYGARNRGRHCLTLLSALNNGDKHRTIQPVWNQPTRIDVAIRDLQDCVVPKLGFRRNPQPLEVGMEITFIRVRKMGSNPHIEVQMRVIAEPSLDNRVSVADWLAQCGGFIARLLVDFSEPPPELLELGAKLVLRTP